MNKKAEIEKRIKIFKEQSIIMEKHYTLQFTNEGTIGKQFIGNKENRICRFCGKDESETTFSDVAHAVPESLGNKDLILLEECDECNHFFGNGIETHFDKVAKPYRNIGQLKGKNKVPSLKSRDKTFRVDIKNDFVIQEMETNPKICVDEDAKTIKYNIEIEPYIPSAVYKALVKMAISIMPEKSLKYFKNAISWIRDSDHKKLLMNPLIIFQKFYPGIRPYDKPIVNLFVNKINGKNNYPYCLFSIMFGNIKYQIVVPSQVDMIFQNIEVSIPIIPNPLDFMNPFGFSTFEHVDYSGINLENNKKIPVCYSFQEMEELDINSEEVKAKISKYIKKTDS